MLDAYSLTLQHHGRSNEVMPKLRKAGIATGRVYLPVGDVYGTMKMRPSLQFIKDNAPSGDSPSRATWPLAVSFKRDGQSGFLTDSGESFGIRIMRYGLKFGPLEYGWVCDGKPWVSRLLHLHEVLT